MTDTQIPQWAMDRAQELYLSTLWGGKGSAKRIAAALATVQRETIEQCAKVADEYVAPDNPNATKAWKEGYATAWIATAIRSLSNQQDAKGERG